MSDLAQVEAARKLYGPAVNSAGTKIFPGFSPGSEMGWGLLGGAQPIRDPIDSFKYVVFNNPVWDWTTLNFDGDVAALEKAFEPAVDAIQPDLRAFAGRGGKLILYHGWNDQLISFLKVFRNAEVSASRARRRAVSGQQ